MLEDACAVRGGEVARRKESMINRLALDSR